MQRIYYVGLLLPSSLNDAIVSIQQKLFDDRLMSKPLEPHITLLPPPAVEEIEPELLARQAKLVAQAFWPLRLSLSDFSARKHHLALTIEGEKIYELQQELAALLPSGTITTYYPEERFSPHITISHTLHGLNFPPEVIKEYNVQLAPLLPTPFTVDHLTLFKWLAPRQYQAIPI